MEIWVATNQNALDERVFLFTAEPIKSGGGWLCSNGPWEAMSMKDFVRCFRFTPGPMTKTRITIHVVEEKPTGRVIILE